MYVKKIDWLCKLSRNLSKWKCLWELAGSSLPSDPRHLQTCCGITCLLLPSPVQQSPQACSGCEPKPTQTYATASTAHPHTCNWHVSVVARLKRQPEKKDALLMRRRGPCSEKARRGLQSWENPVQHKHKKKNMEKKKGRKREEKNNNYWVNEDVRGKIASFLATTHPESTSLKDFIYFFSQGRNIDKQDDLPLTENTSQHLFLSFRRGKDTKYDLIVAKHLEPEGL